jgi:hypothetical protein
MRVESHNNACMRGYITAMNWRGGCSKLFWLPLGLAFMALAACNGTAVVTVTATPSSDTFLAYRVGLSAIQLQTANGKTTLGVLPAQMTVDFAKLVDLSDVVGAPTATKGTYTTAVVTLDYSAAQIVYDDGSLNGVALTPVSASGQALGQVSLTVNLDPSDPFRITAKEAVRLALVFNLAASNVVDLAAKTVTVTPLMAVSSMPVDAKQVRIRGPLLAVDTTNLFFSTGITPFGGIVAGSGGLAIEPSDVTTYEVNGSPATGAAGLTLLAALSQNSLTVSYGTLTASTTNTTSTATTTTTTTTTSTSSTVSFAASQVLAGSSVQGSGLDRVSGIISARSGNTLTIDDGTLIASDGTNTFIPGTVIVNIGANTLVTVFGQGAANVNSPLQVSVGSAVDAFGTATSTSSGDIVLDASAGHVRLDTTSASGLVTVQGNGELTLGLTSLGGRAIRANTPRPRVLWI